MTTGHKPMKIKANVIFSEFVTREFEIDCGLGN